MFSQFGIRIYVAVIFLCLGHYAVAQSTYDASEGKLPISIGAGFSNFDPYFSQGPAPADTNKPGPGRGQMNGAAVWVDGDNRYGKPWTHDFSVEVQYRSIFSGGTAGQQDLKESTFGGGVTYTVRWWRFVHPYGKVLAGVGMIHFAPETLASGRVYSQDSRAVEEFGGGVEARCSSHLWARADYEYQMWGQLLNAHNLEPQGVTVGAVFHFTGSR